MERVVGIAHARAGLLGNPSDGYGGKAVAVCLADFRAQVYLDQDDCFCIRGSDSDGGVFPSLREAQNHLDQFGCEDGIRLLRAAVRRFLVAHPELVRVDAEDPRMRFSIRYETDIPRQVGLAGSSAIVIATLRALAIWFGQKLAPASLADLALAAETRDLGMAAGPMDRVAQAYQGVMSMDLATPGDPSTYRALNAELLPPLFIAWDPGGGQSSWQGHGKLRARWLARDPQVLETIEEFRALVDHGLLLLDRGDQEGFHTAIDRNFELRTRIFEVGDRDREMVALARAQGACAKLCGSGGAVIGMPARSSGFESLERHYLDAGYCFLRPTIEPLHPDAATEARTM